MYKVISQCPVCKNRLKVVKMKCTNCDTVIENDFSLSKFDYLSPEELYFVETFVRCRGNIKEVEKELKISYPTVRSKLDDVIEKLGYRTEKPSKDDTSRRQDILDALEQGKLSAEEAIRQLNGEERGDL